MQSRIDKLCEKCTITRRFYIKLSEYILLQRFHVRGRIFAYFAQWQVYYHRFAIHNTGAWSKQKALK